MKAQQELVTVRDLVDLRKNDMVKANPEYQRGVVWSRDQQMKLIDSVMRGYQLPIIYLHDIKKIVAGRTQESLEVIDGQQRIHALHLFSEGAFSLYKMDDERAKFPKFLQEQPCPWAGKDFKALPDEVKEQFLDTKMTVAYISTDDHNEIRDLFVRLQTGSPLSHQEKRDAYPGDFTDFILSLGGKPEIPKYPGRRFFKTVLGMKPQQDRGKTRTLAAQIAILFLERRERDDPEHFTDINAGAINDYYYRHIDFDSNSAHCKRLIEILDKLEGLLGGNNRPKLQAHVGIHLVLLVDYLWDDYTRSWEKTLASAQDQFSGNLAKANKGKDEVPSPEYWSRYGQWTRTGSDRGDTIRRRHEFYVRQMREFLGPLQIKDPNRSFGSLDKEIIYFRDDKKCQVCGTGVAWPESEFHHVQEHQRGGKTEISNGALVHPHCHPKGAAAQEFAKSWEK